MFKETINQTEMAKKHQQDLNGYAKYFSDSSLSKKLKKVAGKIGKKAVYHIMVLYYTARSPQMPTKAKLKILAALGYFIFPLDFIPDFILFGLGFGDDLVAIAWALYSARKYITPEIREKARQRVDIWFGDARAETHEWAVSPRDDDGLIIDVESVEQ